MPNNPVRIAIIGGTGYSGSHIARESVSRGLAVTAVSRHGTDDPIRGVNYVRGTYSDEALVKQLAADHDVIVFAVHHFAEPALIDELPRIAAATAGSGARLAFVGGAGSTLVTESGPRVVDTPEFAEEWKPEALAAAATLDWLRINGTGMQWFSVSPAAIFGSWVPGEATGKYRTSDDVLIRDENGNSEISGSDFALAFVDEILEPKHINKRFHVAH
jgi:putative NADH-flavin reductase